MKRNTKYILHLSFYYWFSIIFGSQVLAQTIDNHKIRPTTSPNQSLQQLYVAHPNHRELVLKSFELAVNAGFSDFSGITEQEIRDRLEAGAYSEDFESIPGIIGEHFPAPWNQGPDFDFFGLYPFTKIPYGNYTDPLSGWYRGLNHGYDPVQGFKWPGADANTVEWANYPGNSFTWENVIGLYISGNTAVAYESLGHILHLLADLSVPSHVKVVDHGISINSINSGTILDPDLMVLIVDEYEMSLSGGFSIPGIINFIPDLLTQFRSSLDAVDVNNIPALSGWEDYLQELGVQTYDHSIVNQYYLAPAQNGGWGSALNENGIITLPTQYGITPPVELNGRWVQIVLKSTASINGTIIPESDMISMCKYLIPKAVEYGAGLLLHFLSIVTEVDDEQLTPERYQLEQNYPNPFNPTTSIQYTISNRQFVSLKVYDILGNEVAILVNSEKPAGVYEVEWNANRFISGVSAGGGYASGVYFYQLQTEGYIETKKMILMK